MCIKTIMAYLRHIVPFVRFLPTVVLIIVFFCV